MPIFSIFDVKNEYSRTLTCDEVDLFLNLQLGEKYIVGEYQDHYLVNNQPVQKPPRPSDYHNWDVVTKVWVERSDRMALELQEAKTRVMAETEAFKAKAREMLIGVSYEEEANLKEKYEASKRILAGTGSIVDKALIAGEVATRAKYDFLSLAKVIVAKGDAQAAFLAMVKGRANGFDLRIVDALAQSKTADELLAAVRVIRADALAQAKEMLALKAQAEGV